MTLELAQEDLRVPNLGPCERPSPLLFESPTFDPKSHFVSDSIGIRFHVEVKPENKGTEDLLFEEAGPRERIFFDPSQTTAAIVTCGGLSPGLNNVIRSAFYELTVNYGVQHVLGIRHGYVGMTEDSNVRPVELKQDFVESIDKLGGTVLGSSRGHRDPAKMVEFLRSAGVNILLCIGGDGTQRGAHALYEEIKRQQLPIAIVGIPKTIDNDIPFVHQSFGYATSLEKAAEVIRGAHVEARGALNGIGLVNLMGRHAGFIAAGATVVSQEVNFTLVPEIAFPLEGEHGFLAALENRIEQRHHAVVVVAEGAGQHLFPNSEQRWDASGNVSLQPIGPFLKERVIVHFKSRRIPVALKYLNPSYHIRSVPANAFDRFLSDQMARHAVHAGMAGKTGMLIGHQHNQFINVPIPVVTSQTKYMDVTGDLWRAVRQVTRQPAW